MTWLSHSLCIGIILAAMLSANGAEVAPLQPSLSDNRPLKLAAVTPDRTRVPRYGKIELRLNLQGTFTNAFDPDEIDVSGRFTAPGGKIVQASGFYFQSYTHELRGNSEVISLNGIPEWRIRFAPTQIGKYTLTVTARDRTGAQVQSKPVEFECVASNDPGFVRISMDDHRYFVFDNGQPYVPIGANVCWAGSRGLYDYADWLPQYGKSGCNYFRLWLGPAWVTFGLEKTGKPADRFGAGKFDLATSWRLDKVLDMGAKQGMYAMLCLDSFNELRKKVEGSYPYWEETPQNAANGGPLKEPREFWTNPTMRKLYRDKLRYMVARYGWDTHVLSWEFWNEVDIISSSAYVPDEVARWHAEMCDYIRSIDPWQHLRTTSFAYSSGKPEIDSLSQMDYVQTHNYGSRDIAGALSGWQVKKEVYRKPHYVGEFGADTEGKANMEANGIALHNGIWSTLLSGSAGTGMLWWWDSRIHPGNLYHHFASLSGFIKGVNFPKESFKHIEGAEFKSLAASPGPTYRDLEMNGPASWESSVANKPTEVAVGSSGVSVKGQVAGILHGKVNHLDLHNPLTLDVNLPHATTLHVYVRGVSGFGGAHLVISIDGKTAVDKDMPNPASNTKHETMTQYDGEYMVDIPLGKHRLVVENIGTDWMLVGYVLDKAEKRTSPDLRLFGLRGKNVSLLWVQNSLNTWYRVSELKKPTPTQSPALLKIPEWPAGKYRVRLWDTYAGKETGTKDVTVGASGLQIELPGIEKDIALRIEKY